MSARLSYRMRKRRNWFSHANVRSTTHRHAPQTHASCGAWRAKARYGASAVRAESPPRRIGDLRARSPAVAAVAHVRHAAGESHPPTPRLLASRSGSRRSGEPRAARPGPSQIRWRLLPRLARSVGFGPVWSPHRPRGWNNCPLPRATNQYGRSERASPASRSGPDPKRPPIANRVGAASRSSLIRTQVPAEASAKECRYEERRQCRSGTRDPRHAAAHLLGAAVEPARTVRQGPTTRLEAARRSYLFTLLRRRESRFGVLLHALRTFEP